MAGSSSQAGIMGTGERFCFDKDTFFQKRFDVDRFVSRVAGSSAATGTSGIYGASKVGKKVSLETLNADLQKYFGELKIELVELINKEYADFVNLSSNLVGVDYSIKNLKEPLIDIREDILKARGSIDHVIGELESNLNVRSEIREKKQCLQLFLNISLSVRKIESLLNIQSEDNLHEKSEEEVLKGDQTLKDRNEAARKRYSSLSGESSVDSTQLIERVASEFNQLQYYVFSGKDYPFVQKIQFRIDAITSFLSSGLQNSFTEGLLKGESELLKQCFRTYSIIDKAADAEALFRQLVVKPRMQEMLKVAPGKSSVSTFYELVCEFVSSECLSVQILANSVNEKGFKFVERCVFPEVLHALTNEKSYIFAPGIPDKFYENYSDAFKFLDKFEVAYADSEISARRETDGFDSGTKEDLLRQKCSIIEEFRLSQGYSDFLKRWGTQVYCQLRFREIAGFLELAILKSTEEIADATDEPPTPKYILEIRERSDIGLNHNVLRALWVGLNACWAKGVYLRGCSNRLWKLNIQLIGRVKEWISDSFQLQGKVEGGPDSSSSSLNVTPSGSVSNLSEKGDKKERNDHIVSLLELEKDLNTICKKFPSLFDSIISKTLPPELLSGAATTPLDVIYNEVWQQLEMYIPTIVEKVGQKLGAQCCVNLKPVQGITAIYRMTNKDPPTKPSFFVSNILKPASIYLEESDSYAPMWLVKVVDITCKKYTEMVRDLLDTVKKTEESLNRLKRRKEKNDPGNSGNAKMSDEDKIRLQLLLDVQEFGKQCKKLGVSSDTLSSYAGLLETVQQAVKKDDPAAN
eukprot:Nk52_evm11s164 gene=Nk52_evmTU11s164